MGGWSDSTLVEPALEDEIPQSAGRHPDPGDEVRIESGVLGTKPSFPERVQHGGWNGNVYSGADKGQTGPPEAGKAASPRRSSSTCSAHFGFSVRSERILGGGAPGRETMRHRRAIVAITSIPIILAICPPMHERGPAPKGNAAYRGRRLWASSVQRSGSNRLGSGHQRGSRWVTKGLTNTAASAGMRRSPIR
jgi:hypothetical protein